MLPTYDTPERPTILVVDDTPQNLAVMRDLLEGQYQVKLAPSGARALKIAAASPPDLILLDVMMPDMDGYEVCRRLKADPATHEIPVIFLTARGESGDQYRGLELGAVDYIIKPISPPIVEARLRNHLRLKAATDALRDHNTLLESEVAQRTEDLERLQDVTILMLASLAGTRDNETGNHLLRTQNYVRTLAEHLARNPRFASALTARNIDLLFKSAPLHDIGKVGVPDSILLKPGKLDPAEWEIMKTHTTLGRDAIAGAERRLGKDVPFLRFAKEIAYSHQEKWDGSGYPQGLVGEAIPLSARLMAVADVYDALISRRVYKPAFTHEESVDIIARGSGTHFDPEVCSAFMQIHPRFREISIEFADSPEDEAADPAEARQARLARAAGGS
jgi:putative two-component system response regulator